MTKQRVITVESQIIGPCAMSLELPPPAWSGILLCFHVSLGLSSPYYAATPVGNAGLHSTAQGPII